MNWKDLIIIATLITSCQSEEGINDPKKRNENWCWLESPQSGHGRWVPISDNGKVSNGFYTTFYFNGNIRTTGRLENNQNIDTSRWFDLNGNLIGYKIFLKDTFITFYQNNGLFKYHYPTGELMVKGLVENHKEGDSWMTFYENGQIECNIKSNKNISTENWFYKNGQPKRLYRFKDDKYHGINLSYHENGKLLCKTFFNHGIREGEYYSYYENGQIREYKTYSNGLKNGHCKQYFKNGKLKSTKTYINDTIHGLEEFYYEKGGLKKSGQVVNGKFEGIWKEYSENGKLIGTCVFKNNESIKGTKYP